ncbi:hypothetical protein Z517_12285 [Fonsecaea pedrosoi CBS 271.37]|uniref:Uncharacterized protein n=1 Tax=Fonsecaea pedrosoi CBS 271.37 TaxID=1442368 RepID=A0A0D2G6J0_9EURO|nr:uncharacterized protein Z517_12285 [Fonsecaea pedrosoi CBS 271.37]KIW74345.1 hypothetical protein Z517_12285 [Fonsecaea pedrosoi CBS 271.37]
MSSLPGKHMMKVTVTATQELEIQVDEPTNLAYFPESIPHIVLEQLAHRGLNLTSMQVASNPGNICDLQDGQELASAAMKDSAVFHMFNHDHSLPAWNRLPNNVPNKIPLWDKQEAPEARQLALSIQKPITWFYDPVPRPDTKPTLSRIAHCPALSSAPPNTPIAPNLVSASPAEDNHATTEATRLDAQEAMEEVTPAAPRAKGKVKKRGKKKPKTTRVQKQADKVPHRPVTRSQTGKEAAGVIDKLNRSGKGTLATEKRMGGGIHDRPNFAKQVERVGMTQTVHTFGHKHQRRLKQRLAKATEKRWQGQPSGLTEDDKIDVITQQLQKAF